VCAPSPAAAADSPLIVGETSRNGTNLEIFKLGVAALRLAQGGLLPCLIFVANAFSLLPPSC
jgi:hypothetical protein